MGEKDLQRQIDELEQVNEALMNAFEEKAPASKKVMAEVQKVEKLPPKVDGDPFTYRVYIRDEVLELTSDKMLTAGQFRRRYLETFDELLQISKTDWPELVTFLARKAEVVENTTLTDDQVVAEKILQRLRSCEGTDDVGTAVTNEVHCLERDGCVLYYNQFIMDIKDRSGVKISLERLAKSKALKKYLAGSSTTVKNAGQVYRFWVFRKAVLEEVEEGE